MVDFAEMDRFVRLSDLVYNRVGVVNEILGCRYHHAWDNPMRCEREGGNYRVFYGDAVVAKYSVWDTQSAQAAFGVVDDWARCLWLVRRAGRLSPVG